ncbi:hypothetical protein FJT64_008843 [Amphibalanus amphitrite]|uniref:PTB domain-containing protein n=1 Tax=Amphibalanus amphitrite TaxID=1232801 RepID=A0A6A4VJK9_AMPAM|nr:hypothetical protein FJT64_008843 [Amphibalanus amphitrite]
MVDIMRRAEPSSSSYNHWKEDASIDSSSVGGYMPDMHGSFGEGRSSNGVRRTESPDEGAMYLLEHLATFTVSPEMGTLGPRDGMRRLLQMEKTTGIWTQKMELRLRNQSVVIVDHENGILDVFVACGDVFNPYQTVKRRMLDWMKRQELSGNCSARDRFRSCRRNQDGEEVAGQALHLQCLGGVHFNLLKENKNFQTQNTVLVAHIQEQECSDAEDVLLPDSRERIPDIASVREHQHQDRLLHELTSHVRQKLTEQELPRELEHFADFLLKQKHGGVSVPLVSVERQSCWRPGNPSFAPFEVGQLVKRETQRPGNLLTGKFEQRFDGPFKVKSRNSNDVTYTLERDTGAELRAHHTQLRPWITAPSYLRRLEEDLVERFPMHLIREPTAFTSNDPKELYNNIFIFIITEDPSRHSMNPPEMHIFQCLRVSAQQLVEEMKAYLSGKQVRPQRLPPPPSSPPPEPPNGLSGRDQLAMFNAQSRREYTRPAAEHSAQDTVCRHDGVMVGKLLGSLGHC